MRSFLIRLSSRKFLAARVVQVASVAALLWPEHQSALSEAATRIAALATLLLAGIGYGKIESSLDLARSQQQPNTSDQSS